MLCFRSRILILTFLGALLGPTFASNLQPPKAVVPASFFGMHIHHLPDPTPWPNVTIPEWRLWDANVTWADLQPAKGQWRFEKLDGYVSLAEQHGTGLLLTLGGSPAWASAKPQLQSSYSPGFTAEPSNIEDWREYVRTVVSRYKGRIQAYEIWNEPNLRDFWSGSMDQMLMLTREASQVIHSVDPKALVVSPSATTAVYGIPWLAEFLKKGGGKDVDVIAFHFYVDSHTAPPEEMLPIIQGVRRVLAENGLADKPVWNTETGWLPPAKFDSDELAAAFLARAYIVNWAGGVQRFYWYAWDNQYVTLTTYKEDTRTVTPAGRTYEVIQRWIVGTTMNHCTESADHTWTCQLKRKGKSQWIIWNTQGSARFDVPHAWNVASATRLLLDSRPLKGTSIDIGPVPTLLAPR